MSIVSFDDWKKKKQRGSAYNSRGGLRDDVAAREEEGYDLCVFLSEERNAPDADPARIEQLLQQLKALTDSLPREHAYHYFKAFLAWWEGDEQEFFTQFDLYLESEKRLYGELANCDWWIDCFVWVFTPPFTGMYGRVAELFFKYWPLCSMGWVFEALEISESADENLEQELDLLMLALAADPKCYLAHYLIATIYYDLRLWRSALPYFEKAAESSMYSQDPAFYFDYAWAADKAGKYVLALNLYNSCLLLDDKYPCAVNNLGCVYLRMGKPEEALSLFTRAIRLNLDGMLPYRNTVAALEQLGRYDEAIRFIKKHVADGRLNARYELEIPRLSALASGQIAPQSLASPVETGGKKADPAFDKHVIADELERRAEQAGELFGRPCSVYEDDNGYGREYHLPGAGRIDLLLKSERDFMVVAIAQKGEDERGLLRLLRQMSVVKKALCRRFERVYGVLVCTSPSPSLLSLKKALPAEDVSVYELGFTLKELSEKPAEPE